jgi:hypothetical protein
VAVVVPRLAVLPDDPAAAHPDAEVVPDLSRLRRWFAQRAVATLDPLLSAVREVGRYPLRNLWGAVADDLCGSAVWAVRESVGDLARTEAAWAETQALLDDVAALAPHLKVRPRPFPVSWSRGTALFQVRGTCCLYFRTPEAGQRSEEERYCGSCPFREDGQRHRMWADRLEEQGAGEAE